MYHNYIEIRSDIREKCCQSLLVSDSVSHLVRLKFGFSLYDVKFEVLFIHKVFYVTLLI